MMFNTFLAKSCQDQVDGKARLNVIKMLVDTYANIFWPYLQHVHNVFTLGLSHSNKAKCSWNLLKLRAAWWSCVSLKQSWLLKEPIKIKCYLKKKKKTLHTGGCQNGWLRFQMWNLNDPAMQHLLVYSYSGEIHHTRSWCFHFFSTFPFPVTFSEVALTPELLMRVWRWWHAPTFNTFLIKVRRWPTETSAIQGELSVSIGSRSAAGHEALWKDSHRSL